MQFKVGKSYILTQELFDSNLKGKLFVYDELNGNYCLIVTENHAYVCEIEKLKNACEETDIEPEFNYKDVIINDRKQWLNAKLKQLEKLCNE